MERLKEALSPSGLDVTSSVILGEPAQEQVHLTGSPVPAAEQQAFASGRQRIVGFGHNGPAYRVAGPLRKSLYGRRVACRAIGIV